MDKSRFAVIELSNCLKEPAAALRGFANTFSDNQFEKIVNERGLGENYSDRVWENKEYLEKVYKEKHEIY